MNIRLGAVLVLLLAIIFLPYWLYLPLLGAAMIAFPFFWEAILLALLVDVLYGGGVGGVAQLLSPMAFVATLLLIVLLPLRERIRVNV
ncbi:MAG: hypothetical protein AAB780_00025 [Patescibacteria group bacterium]